MLCSRVRTFPKSNRNAEIIFLSENDGGGGGRKERGEATEGIKRFLDEARKYRVFKKHDVTHRYA